MDCDGSVVSVLRAAWSMGAHSVVTADALAGNRVSITPLREYVTRRMSILTTGESVRLTPCARISYAASTNI